MTGKTLTTLIIVTITASVLIAGCSNDSTTTPTPTETQGEILSPEELKAALERIPVGDPSDVEEADLKFMREEEKLAHDVYTELYDLYEKEIFFTIADSEQKHTDVVKNLLDRFGFEDPAEGKGLGEFTNEDLQTLYGHLVSTGSQSLTDALLVGLEIEEVDILDLEEAISRADLPEIIKVYHNIMLGSENHLRAFVSQYEKQTGEIYVPRWLSQEVYDEILGETSGRGRSGKP